MTEREFPHVCYVVDDSNTIRRFTARLMAEEFGFIVGEARDGLEAIEHCHKVNPNLILLDWNMPNMDGLTCLRELRAMNLDPRPVIVMCTTESGLPKIREALEAGADEYIMKPFDRDVMRDKLIELGFEKAPE